MVGRIMILAEKCPESLYYFSAELEEFPRELSTALTRTSKFKANKQLILTQSNKIYVSQSIIVRIFPLKEG